VLIALVLVSCAEPEPPCVESANELPSVALEECDGTPRDLDELNEPRAAWLFLYAGS
jgi:hypothetical protein